MSRALRPGDPGNYHAAHQQEGQWHNRTYIAQIRTIDTVNGTMSVRAIGRGDLDTVMIPVTVSANGAASAWQRYMPTVNDFVQIGFDTMNRPICQGPALWGDDRVPGVTQRAHLGAYARLAELQRSLAPGLAEFLPLHSGEWDMRSSGGAYIKGARTGTLLLMGGTQKVEVSDANKQVAIRAPQLQYASEGTTLTVGDTRFVVNPAVPPAKAFNLDVSQSLTAIDPPLQFANVKVGDIRDNLGIPAPLAFSDGVVGAPLRVLIEAQDSAATGLALGRLQMDTLGNIDLHGNLRVQVDAPTLNLTSAHVALGTSAAANPLLLSTPYRAAEATERTALNAADAAIAAALTLAAGSITTAAALPLPPAQVAGIAAALTVAFGVISPLILQKQTARLTFELPAAIPTYLSPTVFTV